MYENCDGLDYGRRICKQGSCFMQTIYYSQCLLSCPLGWNCQNGALNNFDLWKSDNLENYFYKINQTDWVEYEFVLITRNLKFISSQLDKVLLYDSTQKMFINLNSVDIKTGTDVNNLLFKNKGSWQSIYLKAKSILYLFIIIV